MEPTVDATSTAVVSEPPPVVVLDAAAVPFALNSDADTELVPVDMRVPTFWTACDNCVLKLEYPIEFRDFSIRCPSCRDPFLAKEIELNSIIGRSAKISRRAPRNRNGIYKKSRIEALPSIGSEFVPGNPGSGNGVPGGPSPTTKEAFKETRNKGLTHELVGPCDSDYQVYQDASCEKSAEPIEVAKEASPRDILAALRQIPDLATNDLLRAYSCFIHDDRLFRALMELPMEMRKAWLFIELARK